MARRITAEEAKRLKDLEFDERAMAASQVFGLRLRETREMRNLTQDGLATKMRQYGNPISKRAIHEIEVGKRRLTLDEAFAFTYVLQAVPANMLVPPDGKLVRLSDGFACGGSSVRTWLSSGLAGRSTTPPAKEIAIDVGHEESDRELARLAQNLIDGYRLKSADGGDASQQAVMDMMRELDERRHADAQGQPMRRRRSRRSQP
jgi:hypothetical protein